MKEEIFDIVKELLRHDISKNEAIVKLQALSNLRVSLSEYVEKKKNYAWKEMGDTGNYDYDTEKMNWNEQNFWFGYFRALENLEGKFLEGNKG